MKEFYNVLIAEDEDIIRNGLARSIPWEEKGLKVITARHGREAFDIYNAQEIDMIITDIKMPFMNGIELIESVRELSPTIPIIILSGYDDFKYAQQALRLGANEYLLKPFAMDQFLPLIDKFYQQIKQAEQESLASLYRDIDYNKILNALTTTKDYDYIIPFLNGNTNFAFCMVRLNNFQHNLLHNDYLEMLHTDQQLYSLFEELIDKHQILSIKYQLGERILLISGSTADSIEKILMQIGDLCSKSRNNTPCHSLVSNLHSTIVELGSAYNELIELRNFHFIDFGNSLTTYEFIKAQKHDVGGNSYFNIDTASFQEVILSNDTLTIMDWFSNLQQEISSSYANSPINAMVVSSKIYHLLMSILDEKCELPVQRYLSPETSYSKLMKQTSLDTMFLTLCATALDVSNIITYTQKPSYSDTFQGALTYINEHYSEYDFSLENVSKHANMGRCYLSAMFTQNTGKTFIEYLTELRMKKALELMKNSSKMVYEIAEEVGYQNSTYFSTVFKKYYGKSPKEYRAK